MIDSRLAEVKIVVLGEALTVPPVPVRRGSWGKSCSCETTFLQMEMLAYSEKKKQKQKNKFVFLDNLF